MDIQKMQDYWMKGAELDIEGRYPSEIEKLYTKFTLEYSKPYFDKSQQFFIWLKNLLQN